MEDLRSPIRHIKDAVNSIKKGHSFLHCTFTFYTLMFRTLLTVNDLSLSRLQPLIQSLSWGQQFEQRSFSSSSGGDLSLYHLGLVEGPHCCRHCLNLPIYLPLHFSLTHE